MDKTRSERLTAPLRPCGPPPHEWGGQARSRFSRLPEVDHVVLAHDGHLAPALFVVGRAGVRHGEVRVRRDHAADLVERLDARLAREHLVLDRAAPDPLGPRPTAPPPASRGAAPASVIRLAPPGRAPPT